MDNNNFNTTNETFETVVTEAPAAEKTKKPFPVLGLISMICGILSVLGGCCCYGITFIPAVAAIILALVEKSKSGKMSGFALAGLICGIVGAVIAIAYLVLMLIGFAGGMADGLTNSYYYY